MSRRLVGSTLLATSLLVGTAGAFGATELPRADCDRRLNDSPGDATPMYTAGGQNAPHPGSTSSVPGLDVVSVTMRVTPERLEMYLALQEFPKTFGATDGAYGYEVMFSKGTRNFRIQHMVGNPGARAELRADAVTPGYPQATSGTGTSYTGTAFTGLTSEFEQAKGFIIVSVPRAQLDTLLGTPLAEGDQFTALSAKTYLYPMAPTATATTTRFNADSASATDETATFTVGDEYCLGGPPTFLVEYEQKPVQYGDATELSVTLANEADEAVGDREIQFSIPGEPVLKATTSEEGVATVAFTPTRPAGTYPVTMTWAGDEDAGKSKLVASLVIAPESTKFNALAVAKPSKTARTVTATLLDDDAHLLAGQKVDWYVNGKKAATVATDSKGRSVFKAAKPGQSVQARLAAVAGKYAASASNTAKV
jgi:hypothetical protein